ncbi:MAG: addiction module protein [Polyangia bacterium]
MQRTPDTCPAQREPPATDPHADALWAAEIERRAREVLDGKVELVDADEVHAEIAERLRWTGPRDGNP